MDGASKLRRYDARAIQEQLADEHRLILELVDELTMPRKTEELVPILRELLALLMRHFPREQSPGGFYEAMGANAEKHHGFLRRLMDEHLQILSTARGLIHQAQAETEHGKSELPQAVATFVDLLNEHERKEHQFAMELLEKLT